MSLGTILIIVLIIFLLGGGYYGHDRWGNQGLGGVVVLVLVVGLVLYFLGHLRF